MNRLVGKGPFFCIIYFSCRFMEHMLTLATKEIQSVESYVSDTVILEI